MLQLFHKLEYQQRTSTPCGLPATSAWTDVLVYMERAPALWRVAHQQLERDVSQVGNARGRRQRRAVRQVVQQGRERALQHQAHVPALAERMRQPHDARARRRARAQVAQRPRLLRAELAKLRCRTVGNGGTMATQAGSNRGVCPLKRCTDWSVEAIVAAADSRCAQGGSVQRRECIAVRTLWPANACCRFMTLIATRRPPGRSVSSARTTCRTPAQIVSSHAC